MELFIWLIKFSVSHFISVGHSEMLFTKLFFHILIFFSLCQSADCVFVVFILAFMHIFFESGLGMFIINILKPLNCLSKGT